jgi:hypothetical protein
MPLIIFRNILKTSRPVFTGKLQALNLGLKSEIKQNWYKVPKPTYAL